MHGVLNLKEQTQGGGGKKEEKGGGRAEIIGGIRKDVTLARGN